MDLRPITDTYSAAPQLGPEDMAVLAERGVATVIDNRPDDEIPPSHRAAAMRAAAEAAGLTFVFNPIIHGGLAEAQIERQADAIAASDGPVVAYCASGNRSTIIWALGVAGALPPGDIVRRAAANGYDLGGLRPELERRAATGG